MRLVLSLMGLSLFAPFCMADPPEVRFRKVQLDHRFRSEGVAVGDFNHDGLNDIAAGFVWYAAPDWKLQVVSTKHPWKNGALIETPAHFQPKGYSNCFCAFAEDLNGDSWTDIIICDFPGTPTWWYENPRENGKEWTRHVLTPVTNNESPQMVDLDMDGTREFVAAFNPDAVDIDGPQKKMGYFTRGANPTDPWDVHAVSAAGAQGCNRYSHGLGIGDVNLDGRQDIVCEAGWWEGPEEASGAWSFHEVPFGSGAQIFVYDFDGDGDQDVLTSSPHAFGIWWHEQQAPGQWRKQEIDASFSQTHGVCLADMNGDGLMDFVTGKRWWAHGGADPGADQPAAFYWFELRREGGRPIWIRHQFDHDSGPGTQFEVADVNADGYLDVVSSNKKGVYYFEQFRE